LRKNPSTEQIQGKDGVHGKETIMDQVELEGCVIVS
jgi:hypothetical protein